MRQKLSHRDASTSRKREEMHFSTAKVDSSNNEKENILILCFNLGLHFFIQLLANYYFVGFNQSKNALFDAYKLQSTAFFPCASALLN